MLAILEHLVAGIQVPLTLLVLVIGTPAQRPLAEMADGTSQPPRLARTGVLAKRTQEVVVSAPKKTPLPATTGTRAAPAAMATTGTQAGMTMAVGDNYHRHPLVIDDVKDFVMLLRAVGFSLPSSTTEIEQAYEMFCAISGHGRQLFLSKSA